MTLPTSSKSRPTASCGKEGSKFWTMEQMVISSKFFSWDSFIEKTLCSNRCKGSAYRWFLSWRIHWFSECTFNHDCNSDCGKDFLRHVTLLLAHFSTLSRNTLIDSFVSLLRFKESTRTLLFVQASDIAFIKSKDFSVSDILFHSWSQTLLSRDTLSHAAM